MDPIEWRLKQYRRLQKIFDTWQNRGTNKAELAVEINNMRETIKKKNLHFHSSDRTLLLTRLRDLADKFLKSIDDPKYDFIIRNSLHASMDILKPA